MTRRKTFTKEFKREAVRLLKHAYKTATEIALDLGIRRNQLYQWRDEVESKGETASQGSGRQPRDHESETARLKLRLKRSVIF